MMKKYFLCLTAATLFMNFNINAQSSDFNQGQSTIQLGYGIGNFALGLLSFYQNEPGYSYKSTGPFFLKYEHAISDKIGIGLNVAVATANVDYDVNTSNSSGSTYTYTESVDWIAYSFLIRLNQHFGNVDKFDPYWGIGLGYRNHLLEYSDNDPYNADNQNEEIKSIFPFGFEATIGARYLFTDNFGIYAEAGFAKAVVQFGANVKF